MRTLVSETIIVAIRGCRKLPLNFGAVLDAEGDGTESVIATVNNLDSQLPKNIIPVVSTGDGDYVCIDFRNKEHSTIVYFAHEKNYDDSIVPPAETFTDFLAMLRLEPDDY